MADLAETAEPDVDADVDTIIAECLMPTAPKSFLLYAGAGSGKTYSLVEGLKHLAEEHIDHLRASQQRIAVITYTNAASDEIVDRVDENALFDIRTIHSFCWSQISTLHTDIRKWLLATLPADIAELEQAEAKVVREPRRRLRANAVSRIKTSVWNGSKSRVTSPMIQMATMPDARLYPIARC